MTLLVVWDMKTERILNSKTRTLTCVAWLSVMPQVERSQVGHWVRATAWVAGLALDWMWMRGS